MNLNDFDRGHTALHHLLQQSAHWRRLDAVLKSRLPENLHAYFQVACVRDGCLIVLAKNNMAASRLRMLLPALVPQLQSVDSAIQRLQVRISPSTAQTAAGNPAHLGEGARHALAHAAERLAHHPELAEAMRALSRKQS